MIIFGLHLAGVYANNSLVFTEMVLVGGIGQLTSGIFEFIKGRSYMASVFLTYGIFCLTQFALWYVDVREYVIQSNHSSMAHYYFFWIIITLLIMVCGFRSNMFFVIMQGLQAVMFLLLTIGEGTKEGVINKVGGGFAVAAGVVGMYIGMGQIINEANGKMVVPMIPFCSDNGIDFYGNKNTLNIPAFQEGQQENK